MVPIGSYNHDIIDQTYYWYTELYVMYLDDILAKFGKLAVAISPREPRWPIEWFNFSKISLKCSSNWLGISRVRILLSRQHLLINLAFDTLLVIRQTLKQTIVSKTRKRYCTFLCRRNRNSSPFKKFCKIESLINQNSKEATQSGLADNFETLQ